jgi:hypothetical protein
MKTVLIRNIWLAGLSIAAACGQSPTSVSASPRPQYAVTDLGLVGGPPAQPFVIRNSGLIAGGAAAGNAWHAVLWLGQFKLDIGRTGLGGPNSMAFGVSERGQAVGGAETGAIEPSGEDFCGFGTRRICRPFVWQDGLMSQCAIKVVRRSTRRRVNCRSSSSNR